MAKSCIDTYSIGQRVRLVDIDHPATIQSILFSMDGIEYQVVYWDDNIRRVEWVRPSELCAIKPEVNSQ